MKNIVCGINRWGDMAEEKISQLEDTATKTKSKMKCREKKNQKEKKEKRTSCGTTSRGLICM